MKLASIVVLGMLLGWWFSPWRGGQDQPAPADRGAPDLTRQQPVLGMRAGRVLSLRFQRPTELADGDLVNLTHYVELEVLDLRGAAITDAGLTHLRWLTRLRELYLDGTLVTAAGVTNLATNLPQCAVWWHGRNWNALGPRAMPIPNPLDIRASN